MKYALFTKRTDYPKLGYIIHRLNKLGIACRLQGRSFHGPILEVDESKLGEAWKLLGERRGKHTLDDVRDDHPNFLAYKDVEPTNP